MSSVLQNLKVPPKANETSPRIERMKSVLKNLKIPPKAIDLDRRIEMWEQGKDLERMGFVLDAAAAEKFSKECKGFRWSPASHQAGQDRALQDYRDFMTHVLLQDGVAGLNLDRDRPLDANDHLLFPFDPARTIDNISRFLFVYTLTFGEVEKPGLELLYAVRDALWYWLTGKDMTLPMSPPSRREFSACTNQVLQKIKQDGGFNCNPTPQTYIMEPDLDELLEYDLMQTTNVEVHVQHSIAWLLGYLGGYPPESLCPNKYKDGYLTWRDVRIIRQFTINGVWDGKFVVDIRLPDNDEDHVLDLVSFSPEYNVNRSLPHRLLVLLLRRKYLKKHSTVESLMSGDECIVSIIEEALDYPVFLGVSPCGLHLSDKSASSDSFTEYLQVRTKEMGWSSQLTFYSWRQKFGTGVERAFNADELRLITDKLHVVEGTEDRELPTAYSFSAMMDLLLAYDKVSAPTTCGSCLSFPLQTSATPEKAWEEGLKLYEASDIHKQYGDWKCKAEYVASKLNAEDSKTYECPYGCMNKWDNFWGLLEHIRGSNANAHGHERGKVRGAINRYYEEFLPSCLSEASRRPWQTRTRDEMEALDPDVSNATGT